MHPSSIGSRPTRLAIALSLAFCGALLPRPSVAQVATAATSVYAIPAGPLGQTLQAIAAQSGRKVAFNADTLRDLKAPAVQGTLSAEAAVRAALADTALALSVAANGDLAVNTAAEFTPVTIVAKRDEAETRFKVDRTSTSTRSDSDVMELPSSVSVVTAKEIESRQATTMEDAIKSVSGVIFTRQPQGTPSFAVRGLTDVSVLSNGIGSSFGPSYNPGANLNVFGIERIEVLKGPEAILSGANALSGVVNIVTKKPQAERVADLTAQLASHDDKVAAADFSGALTEDKKLTYRLIGSIERQTTTEFGYDGARGDYLMPELRWKDFDNDLIVGVSYDKRRTPSTGFTFAYRNYMQPTPPQRLGDASDGFLATARTAFYTYDRRITDAVGLTSRMRYMSSDLSLRMQSPLFPISTANDLINFTPTHQESNLSSFSGDHYLRFKADTGPIGHKLSVGFNHDDSNYLQTDYQSSSAAIPVYSTTNTFTRVEGTSFALTASHSSQLGVYALDQLKWGQFDLVLGARKTNYRFDSSSTRVSNGRVTITTPQGTGKATPFAGLVYAITPEVSAYASFTEGFAPQTLSAVCDGGTSSSFPRISRNKEAGMKFDLLDSKLSVTAAVFDLDLRNTVSYNSAQACYRLIASQRTKGAEVDVAGEAYKGLNLVFNATYSKTSDDSGVITAYAARPTFRASLWSTYDFQTPMLQGFGVGLGITGNNWSLLNYEYPTTTTPAPRLGGSVQVDGNVVYRQPRWSLTLGVKNAFDRTLYDFATNPYYVPLRQGRTFALTYKVGI